MTVFWNLCHASPTGSKSPSGLLFSGAI